MRPLMFCVGALVAAFAAGLVSGCITDRGKANWDAYGQIHIVKLYAADGHVIQEWESTGKVECTEGGICDFMDRATGKLVRTTGDIVVTVK